MPKVRLTTKPGAINIEQALDAGECMTCPKSGGGMARITVDHTDNVYRMCGDCISSALAVHIRRAHGLQGRARRLRRGRK